MPIHKYSIGCTVTRSNISFQVDVDMFVIFAWTQHRGRDAYIVEDCDGAGNVFFPEELIFWPCTNLIGVLRSL